MNKLSDIQLYWNLLLLIYFANGKNKKNERAFIWKREKVVKVKK